MNIELVWEKYRSGLKLFINSKVSNPSDAEEILQEVLIKSFKGIASLNSEESFKSWIYQIARNSIIDFYRKNRKLAHESLIEELDSINEKEVVAKELSKCILPFIDLLPDSEKELLIAIEIEGISQKKYSEENEIKYSTLKSRVKKARDMLRKKFEDCCKFSFDSQGNLLDFDQSSDTCKKC